LANRITVLGFLIFIGLGASPLMAQNQCPTLADNHAERGWRFLHAGQIDQAEAAFRSALIDCPRNLVGQVGRGYVDIERGNLDAALVRFETVIARDSTDTGAIAGRGIARWRQGDVDGAKEAFDTVLRLDANYPVALEYLTKINQPPRQPLPPPYHPDPQD